MMVEARITSAQAEYLEALGVSRFEAAAMSRAEAAEKIAALRALPSSAQVAFLKQLKVGEAFIAEMDRRTAALVIRVLLADKARRLAEKRAKKA